MINLGKDDLKELYEDFIKDDLDYIKYLSSSNKIFQLIREKNQDDEEIVELCKKSLFDNDFMISFLKGRVENVRAELKRISLL